MAKLRAVECREFIKAVVEKAEGIRVPVAIAIVNADGNNSTGQDRMALT